MVDGDNPRSSRLARLKNKTQKLLQPGRFRSSSPADCGTSDVDKVSTSSELKDTGLSEGLIAVQTPVAGQTSQLATAETTNVEPSASTLTILTFQDRFVSSRPETCAQSEDGSHTTPQLDISEPRSLWAEAFKALDLEDQKSCEALRAEPKNQEPFSTQVNDLLSSTEQLQKKCEDKTYRFEFGKKTIVMRNTVGNVINWLNKFKAVGDIIVQFDPIHAALPWAGFRLLLQVCDCPIVTGNIHHSYYCGGSLLTC